ncbi:MAG: hypothetical protein KGZ66_00255 [Selenomonadales bacterium]|jgi:DNA-binding Lrp family transcriptional regulator|nr:hypothetical protein [Selenomonadales bacterium]
MVPVKESPIYELVQIVLSKSEPFTIDQILIEVKKKQLGFDDDDVKRRIDRLRDAGVLRKTGVRYARTELIAR